MAVKKTIEIDVRTEEGVKNVQSLNKNIEGTEKQTEATKKATNGLIGSLDRMTGGAITAFRGIVAGAKTGVLAMRSLKVAMAATGIGLLVVAVASLIAYFTQTQRGADIVKRAFDGIGATVSVLMDRISGFGEGLALIFSGEYEKGAAKLSASMKGIGEEIKNEANAAYDLEDALHKVEDREIKLIEVNARRRASIDKLRLAAEDESKSNKERAAALKEATELQNKISNDQIAIAKEKARISKESLGLGESSRDEIRADAELQARVIELESERDKGLMRITTRMNAFTGAEKEGNKAKEESAKKTAEAAKAEKERLENIDKLTEKFRTQKEDFDADTLEKKLALDRERSQTELDGLIQNESEKREAQIALDTYYNAKEDEIAEIRRKEKDDQAATDAAKAAENRRKELQEEQALKDAKNDVQNAHLDNVQNGIRVLQQLAGENKAIQAALLIADNAAGIARIVINTAAANAKAVAAFPVTLGQPWVGINTISAGIGIAGSIAATAKGLQALGQGGSTGSAPKVSGSGGRSSAPTPPPSFNLVGNSQANQLAGAINQNGQPVRAYVVSRNMSSQQEMDRNIRSTASVG